MLATLIKYEFKSSFRKFLPLYVGLVLVSLSIFLIVLINKNSEVSSLISFIMGLLILTYWGVNITVFIFTISTAISRYKNGIYGKEGYLTMTLPASNSEQIASKFIVSLTWFILNVVVLIISTIIILQSPGLEAVKSFVYKSIVEIFTKNLYKAILYIIFLIVSYMATISSIYGVISFSNLFSKNRTVIAVVAYFVINWIWMIVLYFINGLGNVNSYMSTMTSSNSLTINIIENLVFTIICLGYSLYSLDNNLNLD